MRLTTRKSFKSIDVWIWPPRVVDILLCRRRTSSLRLLTTTTTTTTTTTNSATDENHDDRRDDRPCRFYLAHMNYARLKAPLDDPIMSEFVAAIGPVNALARTTPGYVWSLDHPSGEGIEDLSSVPILQDDPILLMPQLSLWDNPQALQHFAFKSGHFMYYKRKREWFTRPTAQHTPWSVCWWFCVSCGDGSTRRKSGGKECMFECDVTNEDTNARDNPQQQQQQNVAIRKTPTLHEAFTRLQILKHNTKPTPEAFDLINAKHFPRP